MILGALCVVAVVALGIGAGVWLDRRHERREAERAEAVKRARSSFYSVDP